MGNNIFQTIATPVARSFSVPDESNTGKQLTLESKGNAVGWYRIFREMAFECGDFRRNRKSVKGGSLGCRKQMR